MKNNINLLVDKKGQSLNKHDPMRVLRFCAIALLFIVSSLSVILFILISLSPLPNLKMQEKLASDTLSHYHTDMAKLYYINERADAAAMILSKRKAYDRSLEIIQSLLPNGVDIDAITVEKNTLSLTVSSKSLNSLNTFITNLTGEAKEKKVFSQISLGNLSLEATKNKYLVILTILLA